MHVYWGKNLSLDSQGELLWDTVDRWTQSEIDVTLTNSFYILWIIIVSGAVIMITVETFGILYIKKKEKIR